MLTREGEDGKIRYIAIQGRSTTKVEQCYPITALETLARAYGFNKLYPMLRAGKFILCTDHKPLVGKQHSGRHISTKSQYFRILLTDLEYDIRYIRGQDNHVADCVSRINPKKAIDLDQWQKALKPLEKHEKKPTKRFRGAKHKRKDKLKKIARLEETTEQNANGLMTTGARSKSQNDVRVMINTPKSREEKSSSKAKHK